MFRRNEDHQQQSFFSGEQLLPEKLQEGLTEGWAETFYQLVFRQIDETRFAVLYSEEASRPNVPVNVLAGVEILKSGYGWSDAELYEQVCYNLQVRHALGLSDLREEVFTLRTLYNFRRRVREYAAETGINLMEKMFEQVTDGQLAVVTVETGWQRMDSTQVLSNLAQMTRLELMVAVLQTVHKGVPGTIAERLGKEWAAYLEKRPHQVCYQIRASESEEHLARIGQALAAMEAGLEEEGAESEALALVRRVLEEQYERETDGAVTLRAAEAVSAGSLQSPHDLEASYRVKGGARYRGGYVANVSETADPKNEVQLITDVQVEPNRTDDARLMKQSLDDQAARQIRVKQITTDGGYTGPDGEATCRDHKVLLRATRMRGGRSAADRWGWEEYGWAMGEGGTPTHVTCPQGCRVGLLPGRKEGRFIARFKAEHCADCPFLDTMCRVENGVRVGPTLYVSERTIEVARQRQQLHPEDTPIRVLVESTVRSLKQAFPGSKLPVRGLIRARMMLYPAAIMVNLRRLHRYFAEKADQTPREAVAFSLSSPRNALIISFAGLRDRFLGFLSSIKRRMIILSPA